VRAVPGAVRRYLEGLRASLPAGFDLTGLKVVLDCAHGATYRVAPRLFRSLGAEVTRSACGRPGRTSTAAWERSIRKGFRRASARRQGRSARVRRGRRSPHRVDESAPPGRRPRPGGLRRGARGSWRAQGRGRCLDRDGNLGLERALTALASRWRGPLWGPLRARGDAAQRGQPRRRAVGHIIFLTRPDRGRLLSALQLLRAVREEGSGSPTSAAKVQSARRCC
jgi:hypothetical protein